MNGSDIKRGWTKNGFYCFQTWFIVKEKMVRTEKEIPLLLVSNELDRYYVYDGPFAGMETFVHGCVMDLHIMWCGQV